MTLSRLNAVLQAIDFIENHIQDEITIADMAEAVSYSIYHFCRIFGGTVYHPPFDYLMRRRLSMAAEELRSTEKRIIDIALAYGFQTPESFSRAFKRLTGLQPSQWRKAPQPDSRMLLQRPSAEYLQHFQLYPPRSPRINTFAERTLLGVMDITPEDTPAAALLRNALDNSLQQQSLSENRILRHTVRDQIPAACPIHVYFTGIETQTVPSAETSLVQRRLPAGEWVSYTHFGGYSRMAHTRAFIYQTWLPRGGLTPGSYTELNIHQDTAVAQTDVIEIQILLSKA